MATFKKYRTKKDQIHWYLILETEEDVCDYMEVDSELLIGEIRNISEQEYKYSTHADSTVGIIASSLLSVLKVGNKSTRDFLGDITYKKMLNMLEIIGEGEKIIINERRGYCDFNKFNEIWELEELDSLPANKPFAFPIDDSINPPLVNHLVLENAPKVHPDDVIDIFNLVSNYRCITSLKEQSKDYIRESVEYATDIYFITDMVDKNQIDIMIYLFDSLLTRKNIHIKTTKKGEERLKNYNKFLKLSVQHNIKFY